MHLSIKFERPIRSCKHSHSHRLSHSFWGGFWLFASTKIVLARARGAAYWQFLGCQTQWQFFTRLSTRGQQQRARAQFCFDGTKKLCKMTIFHRIFDIFGTETHLIYVIWRSKMATFLSLSQRLFPASLSKNSKACNRERASE